MLMAVRLMHIAFTKWGTRAYMDMEHLYAMKRAGYGGEGSGVTHERLAHEDWTALLNGLSA